MALLFIFILMVVYYVYGHGMIPIASRISAFGGRWVKLSE